MVESTPVEVLFSTECSTAQAAFGLFVDDALPVRGSVLFAHSGHPFS